MEININEIISNVRAVDDRAMLAPATLRAIVNAVLAAVDERERHRRQLDIERRVGAGVAHELREVEY